MKICLITNKYNIFLGLYLKYLKKIPNKNLVIVLEKSKFSNKNKRIENLRISNEFKKILNDKNLPKLKNYKNLIVNSINDQNFIKIIKKENISYFLNAGVMEIFKKKSLFNKIINVHPGLLPNYRGCNCPEWSIYYNDPPAISAHLVNKKIDLGPIIKIKILRYKFKDYRSFRSRLYLESIILGCKILTDVYFNKGISKKILISQKKSDGKYFKPMPKKIFKLIKFKNK